MKRSTFLFLSLLLLAVGGCVGFFMRPYLAPEEIDRSANEEMRLGTGRFTNPLLECNAADGTLTSPKQDFNTQLDTFISTLTNTRPTISKIAVSFRDLNNGPSFGTNRNDSFFPASLLKVPVMMAIFKHAESDPSVLARVILFNSDNEIPPGDVAQEIPPEKKLVVGQKYTVSALIEQMIRYSDNQALMLLSEQLTEKEYTDLFKQLGVDTSVIQDPNRTLSARQYSTFFTILYNASYLNQDDSEAALKLLTEGTFDKGLRAGVPADLPIAHKFGERELATGEKQLHDCGIVYYPMHPYLLCIMTRGSDFLVLEKTVADVSSFVYGKVDGEYGQQSNH